MDIDGANIGLSMSTNFIRHKDKSSDALNSIITYLIIKKILIKSSKYKKELETENTIQF